MALAAESRCRASKIRNLGGWGSQLFDRADKRLSCGRQPAFRPRRAHFLPFFERRLSLLTVGISPTDSFRPASSYLLLVRSRNDVTRFESYHKTLCERFSSKPLHGFD